ncbi:MAG: hypothetical protein DRO18_05340 [Thermoprotei archaeon]|nr:MAG: hypothetical protein DRO18_05340 [Thermoprotei archaeon]
MRIKLRLPPRVKVLEALSAISDGRIKELSDKEYEVTSSDGTRRYNVYVDLEKKEVFSTDNGTFYRNYVGYPIIAILMTKGALPFNPKLASALKGINWRRINELFKNYAKVESYIKSLLKRRGIEPEEIDYFISIVMNKLRELNLTKTPR